MKLEQIETVAVIGLGRMGHGIAQTFAAAGYDGVLVGESVVTSVDRRAAVSALRRAPLGPPDGGGGE